jgi:hypothetical protein
MKNKKTDFERLRIYLRSSAFTCGSGDFFTV